MIASDRRTRLRRASLWGGGAPRRRGPVTLPARHGMPGLPECGACESRWAEPTPRVFRTRSAVRLEPRVRPRNRDPGETPPAAQGGFTLPLRGGNFVIPFVHRDKNPPGGGRAPGRPHPAQAAGLWSFRTMIRIFKEQGHSAAAASGLVAAAARSSLAPENGSTVRWCFSQEANWAIVAAWTRDAIRAEAGSCSLGCCRSLCGGGRTCRTGRPARGLALISNVTIPETRVPRRGGRQCC
jgi:hypothetical protein